jgi:hypothetical protein
VTCLMSYVPLCPCLQCSTHSHAFLPKIQHAAEWPYSWDGYGQHEKLNTQFSLRVWYERLWAPNNHTREGELEKLEKWKMRSVFYVLEYCLIFYKVMLFIRVNKGLYRTCRGQSIIPSTSFVSINTKFVKIRFVVF